MTAIQSCASFAKRHDFMLSVAVYVGDYLWLYIWLLLTLTALYGAMQPLFMVNFKII